MLADSTNDNSYCLILQKSDQIHILLSKYVAPVPLRLQVSDE